MNRYTFNLLFGLLAIASLGLSSCEKDALGGEDLSGENPRISTRETPDVLCRDLCDGILLDFSEFNEFDVVSEYQDIAISAWSLASKDPIAFGGQLTPRIFDTVDPDQCNSFDDDDLIFPDGTFGNVLIIQDPNKKGCANDYKKGGMINFDFSALGTVSINCLTLFDTEESGVIDGDRVSGAIYLYDEAGDQMGDYIHIPGISDGSAQVIEVGMSGIARMEVVFLGSGAISSICLNPEDTDPGCTFTQGRWKNKQVRDGAWCVPLDYTFDSWDGGWLDILNTPTRGNAYYILAHQYIAAYLNVNCLDADTDDIEDAFSAAGEWLNAYTPDNWPANTRSVAISLSETLDDFNNGRIGPGKCD